MDRESKTKETASGEEEKKQKVFRRRSKPAACRTRVAGWEGAFEVWALPFNFNTIPDRLE